jgi:hypothetical protein
MLILTYLSHLPFVLTPLQGNDILCILFGYPCKDEIADHLILCNKNSTIDCWQKGFNTHPVGYDDTINWKTATSYVITTSTPSDIFYISLAAPFVYYSKNYSPNIWDLSCNVNHAFCNLTSDLLSNNTVWIIVDRERYNWQLNDFEKKYLKKNCNFIEKGRIWIYRC